MTGQMRSIAITEFKAQCLGLLENVARTGEALVITKHGKPLARVIPSRESGARYLQQSLAGTVTIVGDVMEPALPPEAWNAMTGELIQPARSKTKRSR